MNGKYDNNYFIIGSRAYFQHQPSLTTRVKDITINEVRPFHSRQMWSYRKGPVRWHYELNNHEGLIK